MNEKRKKEIMYNDLKAIAGFLIILALCFALFGCATTPEPKRSDTEFICTKIDCGDEDINDWPSEMDGEPVTQERLDAAVEKMKGVSTVLYCMFMPEECKQD